VSNLLEIMASFDVDKLDEWQSYVHFDAAKRYTRNLIHSHPKYSLMLLCWNASRASPVHAHAGAECIMRTLCGAVREVQYQVIDDDSSFPTKADAVPSRVRIDVTKTTVLDTGMCAHINGLKPLLHVHTYTHSFIHTSIYHCDLGNISCHVL
jgi:hypothetical protein